jgi:hypothetical protein
VRTARHPLAHTGRVGGAVGEQLRREAARHGAPAGAGRAVKEVRVRRAPLRGQRRAEHRQRVRVGLDARQALGGVGRHCAHRRR